MKSGLVSVTFRKLQAAEIVKLVAEAGLDGIEWGGDVHVPHGDIGTAETVRRLTEDAGLAVASYGSYYRTVDSEKDDLPFSRVLETACALGAPSVRVWAGRKGSEEADDAYRAEVVETLQKAGREAREAGLSVGLEFHSHSLTDSNESALALMREVGDDNVGLYWQTTIGASGDYCRDGLAAALPHLVNLHVFHYGVTAEGEPDQRPLSEGVEAWQGYIAQAATTGREHCAMLEFVRGGTPEQFSADAAVLRRLVSGAA